LGLRFALHRRNPAKQCERRGAQAGAAQEGSPPRLEVDNARLAFDLDFDAAALMRIARVHCSTSPVDASQLWLALQSASEVFTGSAEPTGPGCLFLPSSPHSQLRENVVALDHPIRRSDFAERFQTVPRALRPERPIGFAWQEFSIASAPGSIAFPSARRETSLSRSRSGALGPDPARRDAGFPHFRRRLAIRWTLGVVEVAVTDQWTVRGEYM
jgi:hypothetical protein